MAGIPVSETCGQLWVRLPWQRAVRTVDGVSYRRPEVALLFKARLDRPKDRADLLAAGLEPQARAWLADTGITRPRRLGPPG
jgi:hypothetical protein